MHPNPETSLSIATPLHDFKRLSSPPKGNPTPMKQSLHFLPSTQPIPCTNLLPDLMDVIYLNRSLHYALCNRLVNQETICQGKEQRLHSESQKTKMVDQCPKEPSSLSQNLDFFYTKRGGMELIIANFLVQESFVLAVLWVDLITMFL